MSASLRKIWRAFKSIQRRVSPLQSRYRWRFVLSQSKNELPQLLLECLRDCKSAVPDKLKIYPISQNTCVELAYIATEKDHRTISVAIAEISKLIVFEAELVGSNFQNKRVRHHDSWITRKAG